MKRALSYILKRIKQEDLEDTGRKVGRESEGAIEVYVDVCVSEIGTVIDPAVPPGGCQSGQS